MGNEAVELLKELNRYSIARVKLTHACNTCDEVRIYDLDMARFVVEPDPSFLPSVTLSLVVEPLCGTPRTATVTLSPFLIRQPYSIAVIVGQLVLQVGGEMLHHRLRYDGKAT